MHNITENLVRFVDAIADKDPKTKDMCPGTINGHKLIPIANQYNRRFRFFRRLKHIIYNEEGTRNIWYKNNKCYPGVVSMGFSLKRLRHHPNAVSMELYATVFLDNPQQHIIELNTTAFVWLERNDYELI